MQVAWERMNTMSIQKVTALAQAFLEQKCWFWNCV